MGIAGSVVTFLLIWWLVLFLILPRHLTGVWEDGEENHAHGVDRGAPVDPKIWPKLRRTTWIAAALWAVAFVVVNSGIVPTL